MATRTIGASIRLDGERQFNKAMQDVNRNLRTMSAEVRAAESAFLTQGRTQETLRGKQTALQAAYDQTRKKVQILSDQLKDLEAHQMGESAEADRVRASLAGTVAQMNSYEAALRKVDGELEDLARSGEEASEGIQASGESAEEAAGGLDSMDIALGSLLADLATKGVELLKEIGQIGIEYNAQIESYTMAMTTALGSAEAAAAAIADIKLDAAVTPYSVDALVRANQLLIAAGESAGDARETVMALSDAVSATGGGNDELQRMAQNLQQIKNVGKASAMDIKQFQMAGIDVYGILADYTGMAIDQVSELTVTYDLLSKALRNAAGEGGKYFGANAAQASTLNGQISTLQDNVKSKLGEAFQGVSDTLSQKLLPAANEFISGMDMGQLLEQLDRFLDIALAVGGAVTAITALSKLLSFVNAWSAAAAAIKVANGALTATGIEQAVVNGQVSAGAVIYAALTGEIDAATVKQLALNIAMAAAPYAIVATAVAGIVLALRGLSREAEELTKTLSEPWLESDNIEEVKQQLDEVKAKYEEVRAAFDDPWDERYTWFDVKAYRDAVEQLEAHYEELKAAEEAAAQAEAEHQAYLQTTAGKIETVSEKLAELQTAYDEAYQSAYDSLTGQFGLFEKAPEVVTTSTEAMIEALESQAQYYNDYADNLEKIRELTSDSIGLNADLVAGLNDGSAQSVAAAASIVKGYEEALAQGDEAAAAYIDSLNTAFEAQKEAAERAAEEMVQDRKAEIDELTEELDALKEQLAMEDAADKGYLAMTEYYRGMMEKMGDIEDGMTDAGADVLAAFQAGLSSGKLVLPPIHYWIGRGGAVDGYHATGLDYVPFDGYIAELHRGEMVVPADAAQALRQGGGTKNEVNIYTTEVTEAVVDYIYQRVMERGGGEV
ncbi:MAG: tape measure protein [Oscillospiraceae bacterium]|nr:tape measure protein [Oscillospiraceae bacterium]